MNPYLPFPQHVLKCTYCGNEYQHSDPYRFRCSCGSPFGLKYQSSQSGGRISKDGHFFSRYSRFWNTPAQTPFIGLGEGNTPLHTFSYQGRNLLAKLEYLSPTGSYKDRGAAVMLSMLKAAGVKKIIEDSSGNAGGAIAAYSAAADIACTIYCPESASGAKLAFIQSCSANLVRIEGAREKASEEALMRASEIVYGSHVWNPWFLTGVRTLAYELFQQMENLPEEIVMPLGNGALLLGVYQGFLDLKQQQLIREIPALIGVQAEAVAPIYHLWKREKNEIYGKTLAEGIANALPPRAQEIVTAVETSGGRIMKVNEQQIMENWKEAIKCGLLIEPTSAVVLAAESMMPPSEKRLHILTGSLLKTPDVRQKIT